MSTEQLFNSATFLENSNSEILKTSLPKEIVEEVEKIVSFARNEMNHPLAYLKEHHNAGKNKYQISVNKNILNDSFLYPFIIKFAAFYLRQKNVFYKEEEILIEKYSIGNSNYGFWINFSDSGNCNPKHNHSGVLSGIIYFKNDKGVPTNFFCDDNVVQYCGKLGDILVFPSNIPHEVEKIDFIGERITLSFNLEIIPINFIQNTMKHIYNKR